MRETAKLIVVAGSFFLILVLAAGAFMMPDAASAAEAPKSIRIGAVLPLTGRMAQGGNSTVLGYKIAVDFINKAGGVYVKELYAAMPSQCLISAPVTGVQELFYIY